MTLKGIALRKRALAEMQLLTSSLVTVEKGVAGDFRGRPGNRQVTVLSETSWQKACAELGVDLPWYSRRANLLVGGYEFGAADVGRILRIGELRLRITKETDPCERMDQLCPGLSRALSPDWRGGVCCRVVASGEIRVGDSIEMWATQ